LALKVQPAHKVLQVPPELQAHKVLLAMMVPQAQRVPREQLVLKALPAHKACKALRE
jgi:hypothetical protein